MGEIGRLGISSYAYPWSIGVEGFEKPEEPLTAEDLIDNASRHGVSVVQIADNLPLHKRDDLHRLGEFARERDIELEVGTRGTHPDRLRTYLEIAGMLRSDLIRTIVSDPSDLDSAVESLRELKTPCQQSGTRIGLENHDELAAEDLMQVARRAGDHVGICLDTVNSFGALECPDRVIDALAGRTINVHVKDFAIERSPHNMGFELTGCPAGQGRLRVNHLLNVLERESETDFNLILELWPPPEPSLTESIRKEEAWVEESIEFLKSVT